MIVISLSDRGIVDRDLCDLAVEDGQVLRQPVQLPHVSLDGCALVVRQRLTGQPRPAARAEQIRMRALRDQMRMQDRMHLVLDPRAMPHDLVAPRRQSALAFGDGVRRPNLRQISGRLQAGERASVDLVGLDVSLGDRLHLQRIGDDHPRHKGRQHARDRHAVAGRLDHHFIGRPQFLAQPFEGGPGHIDPADMSKDAVFPNHHLAKGPVNINANHASHARLPLVADDGSGGRHDTYGSALTAQPGESQRRPATNASSQLIVRVGLPAPSCSRRLCPGWSHHTPRSTSQQGQ